MGKLTTAVSVAIAATMAGCLARNPATVPEPGPDTAAVSHQLIVGFTGGHVPPQSIRAGNVGLEEIQNLTLGQPMAVYQMPLSAPAGAVLSALQQQKGISWVQQNQIHTTSSSWTGSTWPDNPDLWMQWALSPEVLDPDPLWQRNIDTSHVTIAVLDTGIDPYHPDFGGRVRMGLNAIDGHNDSEDDDGHGTHVTGILGAGGNTGIGIAGICWQCKLMAVKVLDKNGGDDAEAIAGLEYAINNGANVINMSFNSEDTSWSPAYQAVIDEAVKKNIVVVAAAGNDGGPVTQPATTRGLIAVAATTQDDTLASYSNRGPQIGVAAPGNDIFSTWPDDRYKSDSGTSMAAPFVTGAAAVLRAEHPDWSAPAIISAIESSTDPISDLPDSSLHFGRLDLAKLP